MYAAARYFGTIFLVWFGASGMLCMSQEALALHLRLNGLHPRALDPLFVHGTHLGDGWIPVLVSLALLLHSWRAFFLMGGASSFGALVVQFLKRGVFDAGRPGHYLGQMPGLHVPEGVELMHQLSFPSGHSAAAWGMCAAAVLLMREWWSGTALAVLAVFIGYSRVWISQHFLVDVVVGSLIGVASAYCMHRSLQRSLSKGALWLDRSPLLKG
jgi:membrane-associated phospholipid phosphatase